MVLIDCISRTLPGVLAGEEAYMEESHFNGLLSIPSILDHITLGKEVPEVLISSSC